MSRPHVAAWSVGLAALSLVAVAASQADPAEAPFPASDAVPAAESVETVLRATYVLPAGRGRELGDFLRRHAAPGIDVRSITPMLAPERAQDGRIESDRLIVVAPADAQKALGTFIESCISKEPAGSGPTPGDPGRSPFEDAPSNFGASSSDDFAPVRKQSAPGDDFGRPAHDGFQPPPSRTVPSA